MFHPCIIPTLRVSRTVFLILFFLLFFAESFSLVIKFFVFFFHYNYEWTANIFTPKRIYTILDRIFYTHDFLGFLLAFWYILYTCINISFLWSLMTNSEIGKAKTDLAGNQEIHFSSLLNSIKNLEIIMKDHVKNVILDSCLRDNILSSIWCRW